MHRRPRTVLVLIASTALAAVLAMATLPAAAERSAGGKSRNTYAKRAHPKAKRERRAEPKREKRREPKREDRPEPEREDKRPEPKPEEKRPAQPPAEMRLACSRTESRSAVVCEWSASESPSFAGYALWREVTGGGHSREVIATVGDRDTTRHLDPAADADQGYAYAVEARDDHGGVIARSPVVKIAPPATTRTVSLGCARPGDSTSTVTCRWSQSEDPAFASYRLQRVAVERTTSGEERRGEPVTVFESSERSASSFVDNGATRDHGWVYRLSVRDASGAVLAASEPVGVRASDPPPEAEHPAVRLACTAGRPEGRAGVTCTWDRNEAPGFAAYRILRKSGDAEPVVLTRVTDRDRTFHIDRTAQEGQAYAYALQVTDGDGRVIARSEPVRVTCCPSGEHAPEA